MSKVVIDMLENDEIMLQNLCSMLGKDVNSFINMCIKKEMCPYMTHDENYDLTIRKIEGLYKCERPDAPGEYCEVPCWIIEENEKVLWGTEYTKIIIDGALVKVPAERVRKVGKTDQIM